MIGDRLKLLRLEAVRSEAISNQKDFAKLIGITRAGYSHLENNKRSMSIKVLLSIAEVTQCNINWLLTGEGEMFISEQCTTAPYACQLLKIHAEISAGEPAETYDEPVDLIYIDKKVINNINDYYVFKVNGQSMEPGILHQDVVLIKKGHNWSGSDNAICAVRVDGEITLKRIIHGHEHKRLVLVSDNRCFEPIIVDPAHSKIALLGFLHYLIREVQ